jgi:hypothetical protein
VRVNVVDKMARKQYAVEPRQYEGRLLHQLPLLRTPLGDIYVELYLNEPSDSNGVALYRRGTRVIDDLTLLDHFARAPWNLKYLQGHLDASFVSLTPGTRTGIIYDSAYTTLCEGLQPLEVKLIEIIDAQRRAEEEQASREQLRAIQRAFREAMLALPAEEYDWFDIHARAFRPVSNGSEDADRRLEPKALEEPFPGATEPGEEKRRPFFEFAGPLFSVAVSPVSSIVRVGATKELRALPRDRSRRRVEEDLEFHWQLVEGPGELTGVHDQAVTFLAQEEPGLARVRVTVRQREVVCVGEGLVTVTHELLTQLAPTTVPSQGLPGYTLERAPGESWRSKFDIKRNVIVVNNGHRDFVFASRSRSLKLRYLVRLYAKELVMHNFAGLSADQLLERMIELSLRTEEHL